MVASAAAISAGVVANWSSRWSATVSTEYPMSSALRAVSRQAFRSPAVDTCTPNLNGRAPGALPTVIGRRPFAGSAGVGEICRVSGIGSARFARCVRRRALSNGAPFDDVLFDDVVCDDVPCAPEDILAQGCEVSIELAPHLVGISPARVLLATVVRHDRSSRRIRDDDLHRPGHRRRQGAGRLPDGGGRGHRHGGRCPGSRPRVADFAKAGEPTVGCTAVATSTYSVIPGTTTEHRLRHALDVGGCVSQGVLGVRGQAYLPCHRMAAGAGPSRARRLRGPWGGCCGNVLHRRVRPRDDGRRHP